MKSGKLNDPNNLS